ncbi:MAG: outer membrane protein OmpK, partial [Cetobacterium sp.]
MLKKILLLSSLALSTVTFAKYEPWNFTLLEGSLVKANKVPDGWGDSKEEMLFEIQGTTRYKLLDLYWFIDRTNIFKDSSLSNKNDTDSNYTYAEFTPRLSLDGLTKKDLSIGPVSEWFLAYQFDYDNVSSIGWNGNKDGLRKHYFGLGNYISVPEMKYMKFNYFKTNLYARYVDRNYSRDENEWNGYMFNIAYGGTIHKFENGMKFGFSGWLDYDFGAKHHSENQTPDSVQWQNQVRFFLDEHVSLSYTYQINNHF